MQETTAARRISLLKAMPVFASLNEKELLAIVNDLRPKEYQKDEVIFRQGDESYSYNNLTVRTKDPG